jgi:uncharacterized SAM-binding protein YcdF (DUF218 family)/transcriptional regulator with XRE-family HTH domain
MAAVRTWTGREARALRRALRMSVRVFAEYLGVAARTVANWEKLGQATEPRPDTQAILDTALQRADAAEQMRFHLLLAESGAIDVTATTAAAAAPRVWEYETWADDLERVVVALSRQNFATATSLLTRWLGRYEINRLDQRGLYLHARSLVLMGDGLRDQGVLVGPSSAQRSYLKALSQFTQLDVPRRIAQIELSLAVVSEMTGNLQQAAHSYQDLAADERLGGRDRARSLLWVGTALDKDGEHDYATRVMAEASLGDLAAEARPCPPGIRAPGTGTALHRPCPRVRHHRYRPPAGPAQHRPRSHPAVGSANLRAWLDLAGSDRAVGHRLRPDPPAPQHPHHPAQLRERSLTTTGSQNRQAATAQTLRATDAERDLVTDNRATEQHQADARTIWDFHQMHHSLAACAAAIGLGSHDLGVATFAADLYKAGLFPTLVFSGANSPTTAARFPRGEAVHYAEHATELGVPAEAIIVESRATNTGQNITYARQALQDAGIEVESILLISKPYMERRAYATARKVWPDVGLVCASEPLTFDDYLKSIGDEKLVIDMLVGDLQRVIEYPGLGFAIVQDVPDEVQAAYQRLLEDGYDSRLLKH